MSAMMALDSSALWIAFGGLVFLLMGLSLACDAEAHARSVTQWQKSLGPAAPASGRAGSERLVAGYRFVGVAFSLAGLWLLAGLLVFRGRLLGRVSAPSLSGPGQALAGALFSVIGLGFGALRAWSAVAARSYAFVEAEREAASATLRRRVAAASGWLLIATFVFFGLLLLSRAPLRR
jgi:hypothetical protein